ncbi:unnamed protein product [Calypogeia fissa]
MDGGGSKSQTSIRLFAWIVIFSLISTGVCGGRSTLQTEEDFSDSEKFSDSTEFQAEEVRKVPSEGYTLGSKIADWDEQRAKWLQENPGMIFNRKGKPRMILASSSQSEPCPSAAGDHYLMKFLKNKMDYARLHDLDMYYNMVVFEERMKGFFIKLPLVRNLILTHPEAEWIWWMDSDALFTDMSFEIPFEKYKDYNMIVHGWFGEVYDNKNWLGLNAGIFLLRNCQWSLDFLDLWAAMGADIANNREEVGALLSKELLGRPDDFLVDDQSALIYLLSISHTEELKSKVFLEHAYDLHGYWVMAMELHEAKFKDTPMGRLAGHDWSFITHFVGCKTCSGSFASYGVDKCLETMERAYNLADNQVLRIYGYEHEDLSSSNVAPTRPVH